MKIQKAESQKQALEAFYKIGVLKKLANFTGKHLCHSLFLIKLQDDACNFTRKETPTLMVSSEFFEIFKNSFFKEHPWATAAGKPNHLKE